MSDFAFKVTHGESAWTIHADGRIEGFPDGAIVYNQIPLLTHLAHNEGYERAKIEARCMALAGAMADTRFPEKAQPVLVCSLRDAACPTPNRCKFGCTYTGEPK